MPSRPSTRRPRPKTPRATTCSISKAGHCTSTANTTRPSPSSTSFGKELPKSPWARRARFAKAVSLARKGDFRSAELIYRAEAEYLLSTDRKQQIADIYLEFADTYFKPPKEEQKPDYAKALEFYKKALETGAKPEKQIEIELLIGQCQQNLASRPKRPRCSSSSSRTIPPSPLDIEARWRLGTCRLAEGNAREARRVWQDLLAKYVDSQSPRVADAQFDLSRTWNIPNPRRRRAIEPRHGRVAGLPGTLSQARQRRPGPSWKSPRAISTAAGRQTPRPP